MTDVIALWVHNLLIHKQHIQNNKRFNLNKRYDYRGYCLVLLLHHRCPSVFLCLGLALLFRSLSLTLLSLLLIRLLGRLLRSGGRSRSGSGSSSGSRSRGRSDSRSCGRSFNSLCYRRSILKNIAEIPTSYTIDSNSNLISFYQYRIVTHTA